jgi:hypothetical protein
MLGQRAAKGRPNGVRVNGRRHRPITHAFAIVGDTLSGLAEEASEAWHAGIIEDREASRLPRF